eukprot:528890_1
MRSFSILIGFICLNYVLGILQMYSLYRFKSMQSLLIVSKRFPVLVMTESILVIGWLLLLSPLWFNASLEATDFGIPSASYFFYNVAGIPHLTFTHGTFCIEVSRLWLVSYNLHYLHSSQNEKWKSQIDH